MYRDRIVIMERIFSRKMKNKYWWLYGLFFLFFICVHSVLQIKGDGLFFSHLLDENTIIEVLTDRWNTWSSRLLIECVLFFVSRHLWLWRILDSLVMVVLVWSLNHLIFPSCNRNNILLTFLCVIIYPFSDMSTASFCATTLNYLWPLTFMLLGLIPLVDIWRGRSTPQWSYPIFILFVLFASNHEQVACIMLLLGLLAVILHKHHDLPRLYPSLLLLVAVINTVAIVLCPGNDVRTSVAIPMCYMTWPDISILEKAYLAVSSFATIVANNYIVWGLFITMAGYGILKSKCTTPDKIMVGSIFAIWGSVFIFRLWCIVTHADSMFFCYETSSADPFDYSILSIALLTLGLYIIFASIWMIIRLWRDDYWLIPLCIFVLGLASRMMMGLSPTIFVSARRTMIYFYFALLILLLMMIRDRKMIFPAKYQKVIIVCLAVYSLAKYVSMMYMVHNEIGTLGIA